MKESVEIELVELDEVDEKLGDKVFEKLNPKILKGIDVEVKLEIGKAKMSVQELMSLSEGSVVELNTASAQYLNLMVGEEVIAKGKLVVVDGHYGLQLSEVFSL